MSTFGEKRKYPNSNNKKENYEILKKKTTCQNSKEKKGTCQNSIRKIPFIQFIQFILGSFWDYFGIILGSFSF